MGVWCRCVLCAVCADDDLLSGVSISLTHDRKYLSIELSPVVASGFLFCCSSAYMHEHTTYIVDMIRFGVDDKTVNLFCDYDLSAAIKD